MIKSKKTVIIGIDGVPYALMENLSTQGVMHNFQELKKRSIFRKMRSSIPPLSSVAWSSIITGKNPGEHGIFGFTGILPNTYSLSFPDFNSLKVIPFWLKDKKRKYVIINVPATYPVKKLNGVHISGFISLDLEKAVYPSEYLDWLVEINYQVDVDSSLAHRSKSLFLEKLSAVNEARIKAYRYFWEKGNWDVFMLVFTGSDRLGHFFWDAYEDENHQYHQDFLNYFRRVDEVIGEIASKLDKNDTLLILSDHGMERIKTNFYVNYFLKKAGFLNLDSSFKNYNQITTNTQSFALDPGRIYLHKKGKYPRGKVSQNEEEKIIERLTNTFNRLEWQGERVIKRVYRQEEIYRGKFLEQAPDLVLLANSGFRLRGALEKKILFEKDIFTGQHTLDDAFLLVKSKNFQEIPPQPTVEDVEPILNEL